MKTLAKSILIRKETIIKLFLPTVRILAFFTIFSLFFVGIPAFKVNTLKFTFNPRLAYAAIPVVEGFQATSGGADDMGRLTLAPPSGITAGELLIIIVGSDDAEAGDEFSIASGWTQIDEGGNATAQAHIAAFWRVATGTEGKVTVNAATFDDMFGWYIRVSGANINSPINVYNFTQSSTDTTSHAIPQVTTTENDTLVFYGLSFDGGDGYPFSVAGTGWGERGEQTAGTGAENASGTWGTRDMATAGGTGSATVTCAVSDGAAYFQFAVREMTSPDAPTLHDTPFDNIRTGDSAPIYEFTASDPDGSADIIYQIQVDDDYAFGSPLINCESDTSCVAGSGTFSNTVSGGDTNPFNEGERIRFTPATSMTTGNTYYWRVRAEDDSGTGGSGTYGAYSAVQSIRYVSGTDPDEWYQSTDEQLNTGTLTNSETSGADSVELSLGTIAKVGTDTNGTAGALSVSFSHTLEAGTNRLVVVYIGVENGNTADVTGVTYGGVAMTEGETAITGTSGFRYLSEIWYILDADMPSTGSQTVAITGTGTASEPEINGFAAEYTGVYQGPPETTDETAEASSPDDTIENTISPSEHSWVFSTAGCGNTGTSWAQGQNQDELYDFKDTSSLFCVAELRYATGTETTLSSTFTSGANRMTRVSASWQPALASPATVMSPEIDFDFVSGQDVWDEISFSTTESAGDVKLSVYYTVSTPCDTIVPDGILAGNSSGFDVAASPIDISDLYPVSTTYNNICLKATLTDSSGTPYLEDWAVTWTATSYTQNDFEFFVPESSVTLTNPWPPGIGGDLSENEVLTQLPASNMTLKPHDQIRVQMNITAGTIYLNPGARTFKLQYDTAEDCTTATGWTDVGTKGSGEIWRLYDETGIGDTTPQVNDVSTSTSSAEGFYSEINPTGANPNDIQVTETSEWDWPIENNGAIDNTTYCFRMIRGDGTVFAAYNADGYPKITTAPGTSDIMRHGNFFQDSTERGLFWVN
ncbi:hypothetical protein JXA34_01910 [Patescibacteria group bacterium]|nr:hypothetical protein [Patescibacteria group bacterium]